MKTVHRSLILIALALVGCAEQPVLPPSVPNFTTVGVSKGATISKKITSPEAIEGLSEFLRQPRMDWRINGRLVTPTVGDVVLILYSGTTRVEHVEFSDQRLLVGNLIADITPGEVNHLLKITGLTRYDAFTPDSEKRRANQRVDPTSVSAPQNPGGLSED